MALWTVRIGLLALVAGFAAGVVWLQTGSGKDWLAAQIEAAVSAPGSELAIGTLSGAIPFSPTVSDVTMADDDGVWLTVDRATVRLAPMALFSGIARIEVIEAGRVALLREPLPGPQAPEQPAEPFAWPELPVDLELDRLSVAEVALGAPILGESASLSIEGSALLGDVANGLALDLAVERTDDTPGGLTVQMRFVPETGRLTTELQLDEPEGGMLARLGDLPIRQPLTVDLSGDGSLDDWRAELAVDGGDDLRLAGAAEIAVEGSGRRVTVDLAGRLAAFADATLLPLLDDEITLESSVLIGAEGAFGIDQLDLAGGFGEVSLSGQVDLGQETADIALSLVPAASDRFTDLTGGASWGSLRLATTLQGPFPEPTVALTLEGEDLAYGGVALGALDATIAAAAADPLTDADPRLDIDAEIAIEGLDLGDDTTRDLVGAPMEIAVAGTVTPSGGMVIESLSVDSPLAQLAVEGEAEGWGAAAARAMGDLAVPDLSQFTALTGQALAGSAELALEAQWDGAAAALAVDAGLDGLSTGIAQADAMLGPAPRLNVEASLAADGSIEVETLELAAPGASLSADGALGHDALGIDWQVSLADLAAIEPSISGALAAEGRVTGAPNDPAVTAQVTLTDAVLAGYAVPDAELDADLATLASGPTGELALAATVNGLPTEVAADLQVENDGTVLVDALSLQVASLSAQGAVTVLPAGTVSGEVDLRVGTLADLAPFIGQALSGMVEASVSLADVDGQQKVDANVSASGAGLPGEATVARTQLALQVGDALGAPVINSRVQANGILAGGLALDRVVVTAEGGLDRLDLGIDLADERLALVTRATVALADTGTQVDVAALTARYDDVEAALAGPARVTVAPDGVTVDGLVLQAEGGRIAADGRYGDVSDLGITLSELPLDLARLAAPDLGLSGQLDGTISLAGTRAAPQASVDLTATAVTLAAIREAGLSGFDATAALDWRGGELSLDTTVTGDLDGTVSASLVLAAPADPGSGLPRIDDSTGLTGQVTGSANLRALNDLLAGSGDRVGGAMAIDLDLAGTVGDPRVTGMLDLTEGSYANVLSGVALDDIVVRLAGDGERLTIAEFSARTPNGGALGANGAIGIDPDDGFPADLTIGFDDALVIHSDIVSAELAGEVAIAGQLTQSLSVDGRLQVVEAEIRLPEQLPPSVPTLDVEEINIPPEMAARRPPPPPPAGDGAQPLQVALDLTVDAPERIFVRGRGLDAEVGGSVTVGGDAAAPDIGGAFALRRGFLDALGRRFTFEEGSVTLPEDGSVDPEIRFVARTDLEDAVAEVTISGRASAPQIAFSSVPELPQDEVLARILFEKPTSSLTAFEAIQLARSAAELAGVAPGGDVLGDVRDALGVDVIDVEQQDESVESSTLSVGSYVADGVFLGVEQGLQAGSSRVTVEIELTPNISVETDVGADSTGRLGIKMEWDY